MGGSVGATAILHQRQLGLFGMICRLPENILYRIAITKLYSEPDNSSSWFIQIRHLCTLYCLPSPISLLENPLSKFAFKSLVKKQVLDHWQKTLRAETLEKPPLTYFKPNFMSLLHPHPLWIPPRTTPSKWINLLWSPGSLVVNTPLIDILGTGFHPPRRVTAYFVQARSFLAVSNTV